MFLLSLFCPPPFSIPLSLSLSCSFLSCFLLVFLFCFLFAPCFSLFLPFLSSLLLFHERNNINTLNCNFFCSSIFSLFGVSCLVFSFESLFLSLFFLILSKLCFCSTSMFLVSKIKVENTNFGSKGGCNKTVFFMSLCFATCEKLSFLLPIFGQFWWMFKNDYDNLYFSTFLKRKKNKNTILRCYYMGQVGVIIWAKLTAT